MHTGQFLRRHAPLICAALVAVAAGAWFGWQRPGEIDQPRLDALWAAEFKDLSGKPVSMASLRGKPLVINFWATWCGPCKEEMPDFQRFALSEPGKIAQIVGIGIDSASNMQAFSKELGISYLLLESGMAGISILKAVGNKSGALPYTIVVDSRGIAVLTRLGVLKYDELQQAVSLAKRT